MYPSHSRNSKGQFVHKSEVRTEFFEEPSHELAWVLGLLASDGNVESGTARISISQSGEHGRELLLRLKEIIGWTGDLTEAHPAQVPVYRLRFSSLPVKEALAHWGINPNKTHTQSYISLGEEFHSSFIRGCVDGDGSIGVYSVGACSRYLIMSLVGTPHLIERVGSIVPSNSHRVRELNGCTEVRWNGQNAFQAARWIYQSPNLPQTKKSLIWRNYEREINDDRPRWYKKYL